MTDLRGMTAVVAVDRSAMGEAVREALVGCGVKVPMLAEDIDKALVACETHQPDVLLVSFVFNGRPALDLMRVVRRAQGGVGRLNPHLPIIITSHNPQPKQVKACIAAGAHEFLALPASRETYMTLVARAVRGTRDWITSKSYTGPDRRRQQIPNLPFPDRRKQAAEQSSAKPTGEEGDAESHLI